MAYQPPGVTVLEQAQPQVVPLVSSTAEVVLYGPSQGFITVTDQFAISGLGKKYKLPTLGATPKSKLIKITKVEEAFFPEKPEGSNGAGYSKSPTGWEEETEELKIPGGSTIGSTAVLNVTYQYLPAGYWNPIRLFTAAEIISRFGEVFELVNNVPTTNISSPLSLAAIKALENGASSVILQPLFRTSSGSITYDEFGNISNAEKPTEKQISELSPWSTTRNALNKVVAIDLISPVVGMNTNTGSNKITNARVKEIITDCLGYELVRIKEFANFPIGVFGADFSGGGEALEPPKVVKEYAETCRNFGELAQQNVVLNTTNFAIQLPNKPTTLNVGGQYAAAAVAGALAGRPASTSLTRKGLNGFVTVVDARSTPQKNTDAENGTMVIEQIRNGNIRVRHAITTSINEGQARSELSVVRAKFNMIESVKETLENQIIGQIIADSNSPVIVRSAITSVLNILQQTGQLVSFTAPVCTLTSLEPTRMLATFSYRPAFTLNYIEVRFALDLTSQSVTVVEKTTTT